MRPSRFTDAQILQALHDVSAGTPAVRVCRRLGVTETTFYRWRKKFGESSGTTAELHEVRRLRTENKRLKEMVAKLLLGQML